MKGLARTFFVVVILLLLHNGVVSVSAMNTGFSTQLLPTTDRDLFLKNINITVLSDEPNKKAIECFSVNKNGNIAIGYSNGNNKTICIYAADGNFQYGYSFNCSGNFGVELYDDILNVYFVRSDIALSLYPTGEVENILKILNTSDNNKYWNDYVFSTKQVVDDCEYILKNDAGILNGFSSSYSQLIKVNIHNQEELVVYNATPGYFSSIVVFVLVFMFIIFAGLVAFNKYRFKR